MKKSMFLLPLFVLLLSVSVFATGDDLCPEVEKYIVLDTSAEFVLGDDTFTVAFTEIDEADVLSESVVVITVGEETYELNKGEEVTFGAVEIELKDILPIEETVKVKVELSLECASDDDDEGSDDDDSDDDDAKVQECVLEDASVFVGNEVTIALADHEYVVEVVSVTDDDSNDEQTVLFVIGDHEKEVHVGEIEDIADDLFIKVTNVIAVMNDSNDTNDKVTFYLKHCDYVESANCYDSDEGKNKEKYGYVEFGDTKLKDECDGDRILSEAYCHEGTGERVALECNDNELCIDGRCLNKEGDDNGKDEESKGSKECSQGCALEGSCVPIGYRHDAQYCDLSKSFVPQQAVGACENSFECLSNVCADQQCVEQGFIQKLIAWLSRLFG